MYNSNEMFIMRWREYVEKVYKCIRSYFVIKNSRWYKW